MDVTEQAKESADRYHPRYEGFREWLDAEAPEVKAANAGPRHYKRRLVRRNG